MERTKITKYKVMGGLEEEPLTLSRYAFNFLAKQERSSDITMLYLFYWNIRKQENTEYFTCPIEKAMSFLSWGRDKVKRHKQTLIQLGFIHETQEKDILTGRFTRWLIGVNYIDKTHPPENPAGGKKRKRKKKEKEKEKKNQKKNKEKEINKEKEKGGFSREGKHGTLMESINIQLPKEFVNNQPFQNNLSDWIKIRMEKKAPLTETVISRFVSRTGKYSIETMTKALEASADNGWTGLFPERLTETGQNKVNKPTNGYRSGTRKFKDYDECS